MMINYLEEAFDGIAKAAKEAGEFFAAGLHEFVEDSGLAELLRQIASLAITLDTHLLSKNVYIQEMRCEKEQCYE